MRGLPRVEPFRGDQVAAGVVVLTTLAALLQVRMRWTAEEHLIAAGVLAGAVGALVPGLPRAPRPYVSAILLGAQALVAFALLRLAQVLDLSMEGAAVLTAGPLTLIGVELARRHDSAACTLVAAVGGVVVALGLLGLLADPGPSALRVVLLLAAVQAALAAVARRDRRPAHAAQHANAGGLALVALAIVEGEPSWGWQVPLFVGGFGLLAYGAVDRQREPVLVGLAVLVSAIVTAGEGSLLGWPLGLALAAAVMLVIGLRPTTPVPDPDFDEAAPAGELRWFPRRD